MMAITVPAILWATGKENFEKIRNLLLCYMILVLS